MTITDEKKRDLRLITRHGLQPVAGRQLEEACHWVEFVQLWMVTSPSGETRSLAGTDLNNMSEAQVLMIGTWIWQNYLDRPRPAPAEPVQPPQERPARTAPPKPKPEPDEPRRQYDDDTLAREVLEFLREHRRDEFTYNQVKDEIGVADFKQASRVLRALAKRSDDVVRFEKKTQKGEKLELFKFSPHRKALDRDYSRAEEIVSGAILEYLSDEPHQSGTSIRDAMQKWFGHVNDHLVRASLQALVDDGKVNAVPGPRRSTLHSVCLRV